jgi:hypothetical protein
MTKAKVIGPCHICGTNGPLSFEHIPPAAAFNDRKVLLADTNKLFNGNFLNEIENPRGTEIQRGSGSYTLCPSCNSKTGSWYAASYVDLVHSAIPYCYKLESEANAKFLVRTKPLNFLKQILTMFCSACPPDFAAKNPKLVRYLLNKESRDGPFPAIRVFLALFDIKKSLATRQSGITGRLNFQTKQRNIYSEIAFPPFNLVMTLNSPAPDNRLTEITFFNEFEYNQIATINLNLYSFAVVSAYPADYRTKDRITKSTI